MAARCLFKSSTTRTKVTSPFPMYSRASTISPCPSFFSLICSTDFSLARGSCVLLFFLGLPQPPQLQLHPTPCFPMPAVRHPLPVSTSTQTSSSPTPFPTLAGSMYVCFLLAHSVHTTPGGACVNTIPSTASCFHFFTCASSTKQAALQDTHSLHHTLPV